MKRILLLFSVLMLSCIALWAHDVVIDGIYYNLDTTNKTAEVTYRGDVFSSYDEYSGSVTIPETITYNSEIYSVTSIGRSAFSWCSGLTSVTIPNSVTYIGGSAFSDCSGLTSVTISNSVTSIGNYAFSGCSGLTSVTIPNSVTSIGENAFYYCSGLKSVTIPNSVTSIDGGAFYYCSGLTSVTIGESVTSIGSYAFYNCSGLTSVTIPNSVTSIGGSAFYGCSGLTSVTIGESVTSIGSYAFYNCSGLTSVTIPNSVTSIGSSAFSGCSELTSVTIPNSVTSIGSSAFSGCSELTSVTIPNSVTSIGDGAFSSCSRLTSVIWNAKNCKDFEDYDETPFYNIRSNITSFTFGNEVEHIPAYLCYGMSKLTKITIPNSVTSIGYEAFAYCRGLTEVTIPNSVTSIGSSAFIYCSGLTSVIWNAKNCADFEYNSNYNTCTSPFDNIGSNITSFTFGNEVEQIPAYLCYGMSKLSEVTIPNSVTSIGSSAFIYCSGLTSVIWNAKNCTDFEDSDETPFYNIRSNITSFTFGNEVEHIPTYLCYYMNNLKEVTIGKSVTSIGYEAFRACRGLTSVTIPNSVTSIGDYTFYDCSGLTSVTIGESVTSIGDYAFFYCYRLTKVNYLGTVDKWVEIDFETPESNPTYYAKDLYINNELLTDVKITTADSIKNYAFYACKSIKSVEIGSSVTSIGDGAFSFCYGLTSVIWNAKNCADFEYNSDYKTCTSPFYSIGSYITSFTFGNEVEHIPAYLCYKMSNLPEVTILNSVTSIGDEAFYGCSGLTKVNYLGTIDEWVKIDFENSFANPTYYAKDLYINNELLTDVKISEAKFIKDYAFYNCQSIKSVEIGKSVTSIGEYAFSGCSGLTSVTIPNSVTSIGDGAFSSCSRLTSVIWNAKNCADFEYNSNYNTCTSPFYNIGSNITSFTFGNEVEHIPSYLCYGMNYLKENTIPNSVTTIGSGAFKNCSELKSVSIGENVNTIGSEAFAGCDNLKKITMYPMNVPSTQGTETFAHYNAYLYVPCNVYEDYDLDDVFGSFKYIKCIAAEEVDAPDKVEIDVDNDNNATITWPSTDGAKSYELEITKNGKVFCTLLFNEDGQLTSIDFGNRSASVGFQFTVTGLDSASKYAYSMVAMDKKGNELQSYKGTFTTNGYVPGPGEEDEPSAIIETLADANITISNGLITVADADFSIYNLAGQNVTVNNGNLTSGIYMVSINGNIAKVMVK